MTTRKQTNTRMKTKGPATPSEVKASTGRCAYEDCRARLTGPYGTPGVSLSRADNSTLICSRCGTREALDAVGLLGSRFKGEGWV